MKIKAEQIRENLPLVKHPSWIAREIMRLTDNWRHPLPYMGDNSEQVIQDVIAWIKTNNISLAGLTLEQAIAQSAPWRMEYIKGEKPAGCVFCKCLSGYNEYVIYEGKASFVMINRYPYVNGHLMIIPVRHIGKIEDLTQKEKIEIQIIKNRE